MTMAPEYYVLEIYQVQPASCTHINPTVDGYIEGTLANVGVCYPGNYDVGNTVCGPYSTLSLAENAAIDYMYGDPIHTCLPLS